MKHKTKSASPCDLERQHFRDRLHRQAKPKRSGDSAYSLNGLRPKRITHGRSVPIFLVSLRDLFRRSGSELGDQKTPVIPQIPHFRSNPSPRSADSPVRRLSPFHRILNITVSLCHKVDTAKNTFQTRRNTLKPQQNTQNTVKTHSFFSGDPNVNSRSRFISSPMARAARTKDQDEGVRSFDTRQTLDFPTQNAFLKLNLAAIFSLQLLALSLSPHPRSACSAYPFEKNLTLSPQPSAFALHLSPQGRHVATSPCRSELLVVRFAEILLRFTEMSQQTLRHFLLLPTTYINFAETNALKSKLLRHLTHTTIVDSGATTILRCRNSRNTRKPLSLQRLFTFMHIYADNGTAAEIARGLAHLAERDEVMARLIEQVGAFEIKLEADYFTAVVRAIVAQQISTSAARSIYQRLLDASGGTGKLLEGILKFSIPELRALGLSPQKAAYLKDLAEKSRDGIVEWSRMNQLSNEQIIAELTQVKGIGKWTAQMFLIFSLGRLDVFPADDLGVRTAIKNLYRKRTLPKPKQLKRWEKLWHPYSSIASWYCWRSFDLKKKTA
jgi:DNA-3-methyladenine glycosylase II